MTRPKVPPDQRQRIAQACDSCKRRKQKVPIFITFLDNYYPSQPPTCDQHKLTPHRQCNGQTPCVTCDKRKFQCVYSDRQDPVSPPNGGVAQHPAKKRMIENDLDGRHLAGQGNSRSLSIDSPGPYHRASLSFQPHNSITPAQYHPPLSFNSFNFQSANDRTPQPGPTAVKPSQLTDESVRDAALSLQQFSAPRADDSATKTTDDAPSGQSGMDEEAIVYSQTRMLQDPTGRLLYVGDSATLSFLQLIRMMVEFVAGQSRFTTDPRRHKIMESQFSLESTTRRSLLIPHKTTAIILAESFFTNVGTTSKCTCAS